jgi:hypothetical protein
MDKHRYIFRLKPKRPGTSAVWSVQIQNATGTHYARFADSRFGGSSERALQAAVENRDEALKRLGIIDRAYKPDSEHPGVSRTEAEVPTETGTRTVAHWQAYWTRSDGKQQTRRYLVSKYGEQRAKELAIAAREHALRAMDSGIDPFFEVPPDRAALWRYMDFAKFLAMLQDKALFFSAAKNFEDPYEGSLSQANVWRRSFVLSRSQGKKSPAQQVSDDSSLVISCWYAAKHESAAMWQLYSRNTDAIAIRTTVRHLRAALPPKAHMGLVKYVDYTKTWIPESDPTLRYFHKRLSFQHEHELRAAIDTKQPEVALHGNIVPGGYKLLISLEQLIDAVYIGPKSSDWFVELVEGVCKRYGILAKPTRSSLYEGPIL